MMEKIDRFEIIEGRNSCRIYDLKEHEEVASVELKYKAHTRELAKEILEVVGDYFYRNDGIDGEEI